MNRDDFSGVPLVRCSQCDSLYDKRSGVPGDDRCPTCLGRSRRRR